MELIETIEMTDDSGVTWVTDIYKTKGGGTYENTYRKES